MCQHLVCGPHLRRTLSVTVAVTTVCVLVSMFYTSPYFSNGYASNTLPWRLTQSEGEQSLPQIIIVGVRKCGTRALLEFLSLHPDIRHSHDEVHFFDREERFALGYDWYRRQMPRALPGQFTMEKTPGYFIARDAPDRIYAMNRTIKLIMIVRDPVTRTLSDYMQTYSKNLKKNASYPAFEDLVLDPETSDISPNYKPTWISLYYLHWLNWQQRFNRSQIHLVDGDEFISNPLMELQKIETFLGVQPHLTPDKVYFNETRGFYCLKQGTTSRCLNPSKGRPHPKVRPRVMHKLYRFFNEPNERFFKLTGQYFDWTEETRRKKAKRSIR